jgi:hypothetical protein
MPPQEQLDLGYTLNFIAQQEKLLTSTGSAAGSKPNTKFKVTEGA